MDTFWQFLLQEQVAAILIATLIFLITIILVAIRKISFSITLLLLLFSLLVGLAVNNQSAFQAYMAQPSSNISEQQDAFNKQIQHAYENLQSEVNSERENIVRLLGQVMEVFDQVEEQKEKLQNFIEETRSHFNESKANDNPSRPESLKPRNGD